MTLEEVHSGAESTGACKVLGGELACPPEDSNGLVGAHGCRGYQAEVLDELGDERGWGLSEDEESVWETDDEEEAEEEEEEEEADEDEEEEAEEAEEEEEEGEEEGEDEEAEADGTHLYLPLEMRRRIAAAGGNNLDPRESEFDPMCFRLEVARARVRAAIRGKASVLGRG